MAAEAEVQMQVIARGITLSSASVPATICSIPICMRREAHYVAALMWEEEGAGERWGGRGRDEGNGALEARRTDIGEASEVFGMRSLH